MPRINLLPWREQQRVERKKAFGVGMFGALIAAVAVAGVGWLLLNQMMEAQQDRNALLRTEIKVLDKKIEEINDLEAQKQQHIARMDIIEKLQRSRPEIVHVFDTFTRIVPDGVHLTSLKQTGTNFRIQGVAQSGTRVSNFMRQIEDSEWLDSAGLDKVEATRTSGQSMNFILGAKQIDTQPASGGNSK